MLCTNPVGVRGAWGYLVANNPRVGIPPAGRARRALETGVAHGGLGEGGGVEGGGGGDSGEGGGGEGDVHPLLREHLRTSLSCS